MPPPVRTRHPTGIDSLEWIDTDDGSRTLLDARLNETFHSGCGAVAETLIVYLWHSGIVQRLRSGAPSVVIEYGLGTGTGLLLTAALAEFTATPLSYYALECSLLPATLLGSLQLEAATESCIKTGDAKPARGNDPQFLPHHFRALPRLVDRLSALLSDPALQSSNSSGLTAATWQLSEFVELRLLLGDIRQLNHDAQSDIEPGLCDAIYFDPFSPETNPDVWSPSVFRVAAELLKPGGRLTSYCVKSSVRHDLQNCGFQVGKAPGPLRGKREVLCAIKPCCTTMP